MIKHQIEQTLHAQLEQVLTTLYPDKGSDIQTFLEEKPTKLEVPKHSEQGDYATNIAMQLAKVLREAPKSSAEKIADHLNQLPENKDRITCVPINGFLNIRLHDAYIWDLTITNPLQPNFPKTTDKLLVEYVSANPTGPLHIGHARWGVLGSIICNLLNVTNHSVSSEFYINNAGNQVTNFYNSVNAVKNGDSIPEDGYHGSYINDLAAQDQDPLQAMIQHQKKTLETAGVIFDTWFSEKTLHNTQDIPQVIDTLTEKGLTYKEGGALWFKSSELGDEKDRVLIKADGNKTYFLVDLAYHLNKLERGFNRLVNIWGADHHGYINRVKAGVKALTETTQDTHYDLTILIGQLVNLTRDGKPVRMSKRTGEMITFDEVLEEIGHDATRYFLAQHSSDTHLEFDLELAKKQSSENPVYYVQYAHARICSVQKKVEDSTVATTITRSLEPQERALLLQSLTYADKLWEAATQYAPYKLIQYSYELAKLFHTFYENCPIIKADPSVKGERLAILNATQATLRKCLDVLGISAPESM